MWCVCGTVMFALMRNENYELFDVMICGKQMMMNQRVKQPNLTMHHILFNLRVRGTFMSEHVLNVEEKESRPSSASLHVVCEPHVVCAIPFLSNTFTSVRRQ